MTLLNNYLIYTMETEILRLQKKLDDCIYLANKQKEHFEHENRDTLVTKIFGKSHFMLDLHKEKMDYHINKGNEYAHRIQYLQNVLKEHREENNT